MEELHSVDLQTARVVWRVLAVVILLGLGMTLYIAVQDLRFNLAFSRDHVRALEEYVGAAVRFVFFGALGIVGAGMLWGKDRTFLRLSNGTLEEHWFFWEKECVNVVDLRTVTEVTYGDHTIYGYRGAQVRSAFLFTDPQVSSLAHTDREKMENQPYILTPNGVPEANIKLFLEKIREEIKQVHP